jgi:hypothetical protein
LKTVLSRVGRAVLAALTSPEAVKAEKSIAVLVVTRVLLAVGASAGLVELAVKAFS